MKKIFTLFGMAAMLLASAVFTACESDPDVEESMVLSGQWYGYWGMYYDYQFRNGAVERFYSTTTDVEFIPDDYYTTHGHGYQVDWYNEGPYERLSYKFYWEIDRGVIYLTYPGNHHYDVDIYDYHLNYDYFTGRFSIDGDQFRLRKLSDFYWNDYYAYDYYAWEWDYGYPYAKTRTPADSVAATPADGEIIGAGSLLSKPRQ